MLDYQKVKAAKVLKNEIELALIKGTSVSGTTTVAPNLGGMIEKLSAGSCWTSSSGTTLTETVFNDILQLTYSYSRSPKEVYANVLTKRTINGFTTNVSRQMNAMEHRQTNRVDVLDTEFGTMAVFKERYLPQAASKTAYGNTWFAIDPDAFKIGWLRPIKEEVLGKDGDRERRMLLGELTLIVKSKNAGCGADGHVAYITG